MSTTKNDTGCVTGASPRPIGVRQCGDVFNFTTLPIISSVHLEVQPNKQTNPPELGDTLSCQKLPIKLTNDSPDWSKTYLGYDPLSATPNIKGAIKPNFRERFIQQPHTPVLRHSHSKDSSYKNDGWIRDLCAEGVEPNPGPCRPVIYHSGDLERCSHNPCLLSCHYVRASADAAAKRRLDEKAAKAKTRPRKPPRFNVCLCGDPNTCPRAADGHLHICDTFSHTDVAQPSLILAERYSEVPDRCKHSGECSPPALGAELPEDTTPDVMFNAFRNEPLSSVVDDRPKKTTMPRLTVNGDVTPLKFNSASTTRDLTGVSDQKAVESTVPQVKDSKKKVKSVSFADTTRIAEVHSSVAERLPDDDTLHGDDTISIDNALFPSSAIEAADERETLSVLSNHRNDSTTQPLSGNESLPPLPPIDEPKEKLFVKKEYIYFNGDQPDPTDRKSVV